MGTSGCFSANDSHALGPGHQALPRAPHPGAQTHSAPTGVCGGAGHTVWMSCRTLPACTLPQPPYMHTAQELQSRAGQCPPHSELQTSSTSDRASTGRAQRERGRREGGCRALWLLEALPSSECRMGSTSPSYSWERGPALLWATMQHSTDIFLPPLQAARQCLYVYTGSRRGAQQQHRKEIVLPSPSPVTSVSASPFCVCSTRLTQR